MVVFLTVQNSFWVACGIVYFSCMLMVVVIAFAGGNRRSGISSSVASKNKLGELTAEGLDASEDLGRFQGRLRNRFTLVFSIHEIMTVRLPNQAAVFYMSVISG